MEEISHPLNYRDKNLYLDEVKIADVIKTHGTPLYIYSEKTLIKNFQAFQNGATKAGIIAPLFCYAMKANSNKDFLSILAKQGSGADIVSGGELMRAIQAGINPMKIVFSGVGKTTQEIEQALNASLQGIYSFNVESLEELELINKLAHQKGKRARVSFRLNPRVKAKTHKFISTGHKSHKFGLTQQDILKSLAESKYWSSTKLVGLSIHIGSQLTDLSATKKAIKTLCETALKINQELEFIDVGGGLGLNYEAKQKVATIADYMKLVHQTTWYMYEKQKKVRPRLVFEPGRIIAARAGVYITSILRHKDSAGARFMIVDGGMNDFVRPSLYNAYHEIYPGVQNDGKIVPIDIVGPICESTDFFGMQRKLPPMKAGDFIAIADTGAYGQTMSSNYNLKVRSAEILVTKDGEIKLITPREQYHQLR